MILSATVSIGTKEQASMSDLLKPLPREPTSLAELAETYRGLADVVGLVIASLIGRGVLG